MWQRLISLRKDGLLAIAVAASSVGMLWSASNDRDYMMDYDHASNVQSDACGDIVTKQKLKELRENGICVIDGVCDSHTLRGAVTESRQLFTKRNDDNMNNAADIRQDHVIWVRNTVGEGCNIGASPSTKTRQPHLASITHLLRGVAHEISRDSSLVSGQLVVPRLMQLSKYKSHGGYRPHRDACIESITELGKLCLPLFYRIIQLGLYQYYTRREYRERRYTAIIYINSDEVYTGEGGALRCYMGAKQGDNTGDSSSNITHISPTGGRLVIFDSRQVLHEVVPFQDADRQRIALTSWIGEIEYDDDVLERRDSNRL